MNNWTPIASFRQVGIITHSWEVNSKMLSFPGTKCTRRGAGTSASCGEWWHHLLICFVQLMLARWRSTQRVQKFLLSRSLYKHASELLQTLFIFFFIAERIQSWKPVLFGTEESHELFGWVVFFLSLSTTQILRLIVLLRKSHFRYRLRKNWSWGFRRWSIETCIQQL